MEIKQTFPNNQQVTEKIKREIKKKSRNKWQWKDDNSKPMGCSKSRFEREVYSNTVLPKKQGKTPNRQPKFTSKSTGKRGRRTTTKKPQN